MKRIFAVLLLAFSSPVFSCSFAPMTQEFEITGEEAEAPERPNFELKSIKRGFYDGNGGSCSDAGMITLKNISKNSRDVGYKFSIVEGAFEDTIFGDNPIVPSNFVEESEFTFIWFDGHTDEQEPFEITIEITPVSKSGSTGESARLIVAHPGVEKPWWKIW
ncbi:hypothetical protein [Microbulbifer sp. GL-2]|uniref:hypothetical protein n=1 Tax=Microbulbifer sp. GL-2 TaxID=2591606 RepID=UPI00117D94DC|nr:hypothetical protein [Microbulbifer sp. GL-2]